MSRLGWKRDLCPTVTLEFHFRQCPSPPPSSHPTEITLRPNKTIASHMSRIVILVTILSTSYHVQGDFLLYVQRSTNKIPNKLSTDLPFKNISSLYFLQIHTSFVLHFHIRSQARSYSYKTQCRESGGRAERRRFESRFWPLTFISSLPFT